MSNQKTPMQIAEEWYNLELIHYSVATTKPCPIPADIQSVEFSTWLTEQYRLAMAKGIQLARDETADYVRRREQNWQDGHAVQEMRHKEATESLKAEIAILMETIDELQTKRIEAATDGSTWKSRALKAEYKLQYLLGPDDEEDDR